MPSAPSRTTRSGAALRLLTVAAVAVLSTTACGPAVDDTTGTAPNDETAAGADESRVTTAAPAAPSTGSSAGGLAKGSVPFAGKEDIVATVSMPPGWSTWSVFVLRDDTVPATGLAFYDVGNMYSDPCRWILLDSPMGPTVDDLVAAFEESSMFQATPATDVTVDSFPGKYSQVTVPDYDEETCAKFGLYQEDGSTNVSPEPLGTGTP